MNQLQALQPYFNIKIKDLIGTVFADITPYIDSVEYEEQADMIRTMTFTIGKLADVFIQRLSVSMEVILYGGRLGIYAKIFVGRILRVKIQAPNDGSMSIAVECMSTAWTALGKEITNRNVYPDLKSTRAFAKGKDLMKISDIVRGIVTENGMQIGTTPNGEEAILINAKEDTEYSLTASVQQNRISDWGLLTKLAKKCNCTLWTEFDKDNEKLFFVDRSKVRNMETNYYKKGDKIAFVYPLRGLPYPATGIKRLADRDRSFQQTSLAPNETLMFDVTIEQDLASANSISYGASSFNMDTGDMELHPLSEIIHQKDGKTLLRYYELDDEKIRAMELTNPALAQQLRSMNPTSIPWDTVKQYLRHVDIAEEDTAIYDQAFFGITVNCTIQGDINVRSQRAYKLYGIMTFSSDKEQGSYWLYSLRHRWTGEEFLTDLTFKR